MTLRSVNYPNYSVISTLQCQTTHHIFYSVAIYRKVILLGDSNEFCLA